MSNNINEPENTGMKIKTGGALSKKPSNENVPAGGCKQRNTWPRVVANPTDIPLVKVVVSKKNTQRTVEIVPNKFPKTRFLG